VKSTSDPTSNAVVLNGIGKTYENGTVVAVHDVSFEVRPGELFGLIGPDGAGKTSLFRILTTLLLPDAGTATVAGYDVVKDFRAIRGIVGYMPGKFSLYQDLSVEENLNFFATLFGTSVAKNYDLIRDIYVQLEPFKHRRAGKLSGGMKQKLALCCALIHKPQVLFLDEPTTGVDPVSRKEFWEMLKRLKEQGITILISTPYMDEAMMCERIALIQGGRIMSIDTPENIMQAFPATLYAVRAADAYHLRMDLLAAPFTESCHAFGDEVHLTLHTEGTTKAAGMEDVVSAMRARGHVDVEIREIAPSIEDCFIRLMGQHHA
jgi:ABC-2 type transport system ATP-binding protein